MQTTTALTRTFSRAPSADEILAAQVNAPICARTIRKNWSQQEDAALQEGVAAFGERNWKDVAEIVKSRNHTQCMQRWSKALKPGLKKGHWTAQEDAILLEMAGTYEKNWAKVVQHIPNRTVKQIRERWSNHVNPIVNHAPFSEEEDSILVQMHEELGNKWALIAKKLNSRTAEGVKIRWKSLCRKSKHEMKRQQQQAQHGDISQSMHVCTTKVSRKRTLPVRVDSASPIKKVCVSKRFHERSYSPTGTAELFMQKRSTAPISGSLQNLLIDDSFLASLGLTDDIKIEGDETEDETDEEDVLSFLDDVEFFGEIDGAEISLASMIAV